MCLLQSEASGQSQTSVAWFVSMEWEGDANKTDLKKRLAQLEFQVSSVLLVVCSMHLSLAEGTALGYWSLQTVDLNLKRGRECISRNYTGRKSGVKMNIISREADFPLFSVANAVPAIMGWQVLLRYRDCLIADSLHLISVNFPERVFLAL